MSDTQRYRFIGANHTHDGDRLEHGDVVELTDRQQRFFGHKFEPTTEGDDIPAAAGGGDDEDPDGDDATETCDAELSSGGTCGRDLPCPYHSED